MIQRRARGEADRGAPDQEDPRQRRAVARRRAQRASRRSASSSARRARPRPAASPRRRSSTPMRSSSTRTRTSVVTQDGWIKLLIRELKIRTDAHPRGVRLGDGRAAGLHEGEGDLLHESRKRASSRSTTSRPHHRLRRSAQKFFKLLLMARRSSAAMTLDARALVPPMLLAVTKQRGYGLRFADRGAPRGHHEGGPRQYARPPRATRCSAWSRATTATWCCARRATRTCCAARPTRSRNLCQGVAVIVNDDDAVIGLSPAQHVAYRGIESSARP